MESYLTMLLFNLDSKSTTQFFKINGINTLQKYSKLVKLPEGNRKATEVLCAESR